MKSTIKNNKGRIFKTLLLALLIVGSIAPILFSSSVASAANYTTQDAEDACKIKVNETACVTALKKCDTGDSICVVKAVAKGGDNVLKVCRTRPNPQNCNTRVLSECTGKTGTELQTCQEQSAVSPDSKGVVTLDTGADKPYQCGGGDDAVKTQFNFGCQGKGGVIEDFAYAIIRFLSYGVGLVLAASLIYAGIMYSTSSGNPENTQAAKKRILNTMIGLIFYIFIFAIIQYLVPGGLFN